LGARVRGALLVAPADPRHFRLSKRIPRSRLGFPSIVVASRNDPWIPLGAARLWAERWGSRFVDIGDAGHINVDAGFGDWPFGERLLHSLARRHVPLSKAASQPAWIPAHPQRFAFAI
jgi:predicted alpha/beta hydrolase family esterase